MLCPIKIFVEGPADKKFLSDYIKHILPSITIDKNMFIACKGWANSSEAFKTQMIKNSDSGGVNLVIFDADNDFCKRKPEINKNFQGANFNLFLFPDNKSKGALEDLLENIIADVNKPIFECWKSYETCLSSKKLTVPSKKSKIYAYLGALLDRTNKEQDKARDINRDYSNANHWNLDAGFLEPLKEFLLENIPLKTEK